MLTIKLFNFSAEFVFLILLMVSDHIESLYMISARSRLFSTNLHQEVLKLDEFNDIKPSKALFVDGMSLFMECLKPTPNHHDKMTLLYHLSELKLATGWIVDLVWFDATMTESVEFLQDQFTLTHISSMENFDVHVERLCHFFRMEGITNIAIVTRELGLKTIATYSEIEVVPPKKLLSIIRNNYMDPSLKKAQVKESVKLAFEEFKKEYGNLEIHYNHTVPISPQFTSTTYGLKLGIIASRIRTRGDFADCHDHLRQLGFSFQKKPTNRFSETVQALLCYNNTYGSMTVPVKFVVSANSSFPESMWGMRLGERAANLRQGSFSSPENKKTLHNIGFRLHKLRDRRNFDDIYDALITYKELHGHLKVPASFVVPPTDDYPVRCHNLRLGQRVMHIRNRGDFSEHREVLDAMGFVWDAWKDTVFQNIMQELEALRAIRERCRRKSPVLVPTPASASYPAKPIVSIDRSPTGKSSQRRRKGG